jgi:hypothetical protein
MGLDLRPLLNICQRRASRRHPFREEIVKTEGTLSVMSEKTRSGETMLNVWIFDLLFAELLCIFSFYIVAALGEDADLAELWSHKTIERADNPINQLLKFAYDVCL